MEAVLKSGSPIMLPYTPSGADVAAGEVIVVGDLPLIAHHDIADGDKNALAAGGGVYTVAKISATACTAGAKAYWDPTNNYITPTAGSLKIFGYFGTAGALSADTTAEVLHKPGG